MLQYHSRLLLFKCLYVVTINVLQYVSYIQLDINQLPLWTSAMNQCYNFTNITVEFNSSSFLNFFISIILQYNSQQISNYLS